MTKEGGGGLPTSITLGDSLLQRLAASSPTTPHARTTHTTHTHTTTSASPAQQIYTAVKYSFKPDSIDYSQPGRLISTPSSSALQGSDETNWTLEYEHLRQGGGVHRFNGVQKTGKDIECLLFYDPVTRTFTLEHLDSTMTMGAIRSGSSGSSSNSNAVSSTATGNGNTTPTLSGSSGVSFVNGSGGAAKVAGMTGVAGGVPAQRGRPRKYPTTTTTSDAAEGDGGGGGGGGVSSVTAVSGKGGDGPKRKGRPPKIPRKIETMSEVTSSIDTAVETEMVQQQVPPPSLPLHTPSPIPTSAISTDSQNGVPVSTLSQSDSDDDDDVDDDDDDEDKDRGRLDDILHDEIDGALDELDFEFDDGDAAAAMDVVVEGKGGDEAQSSLPKRGPISLTAKSGDDSDSGLSDSDESE